MIGGFAMKAAPSQVSTGSKNQVPLRSKRRKGGGKVGGDETNTQKPNPRETC